MSRTSFFAAITFAIAAQSMPAASQDLFVARFRADCAGYSTNRDRVASIRITERSIISRATGVSLKSRSALGQYTLVYNRSDDSLQVYHTNGTFVADVLHFSSGALVEDARRSTRFALLFFPGQTNHLGAETNLLGSAAISERIKRDRDVRDAAGEPVTVTNYTGRLQYMLSGLALGSTNFADLDDAEATATASTSTTTNDTGLQPFDAALSEFSVNDPLVRICIATFTASRPFEPEGADADTTAGGGDAGTGSISGSDTNALRGTETGVKNTVPFPPIGTGIGDTGLTNSTGTINTNLPGATDLPGTGLTNAIPGTSSTNAVPDTNGLPAGTGTLPGTGSTGTGSTSGFAPPLPGTGAALSTGTLTGQSGTATGATGTAAGL